MKKTLLLCRHADALPAKSGEADKNRDLSAKGVLECLQGHKWLQQHTSEDFIVTSSHARRALKTAEKLSGNYKGHKVIISHELYEASSLQLLRYLTSLPDFYSTALLVGHNPGISTLATSLTGEPINFGTCQMVLLELQAERWPEVSYQTASIKKVFVPA